MRVLILRTDHMGDVALTVPPVVATVRAAAPDARIDLLCSSIGARVGATIDGIRETVVLDLPSAGVAGRQSQVRAAAACASLVLGSRTERGARLDPAGYDVAFVLSFGPVGSLVARAVARRRIGFRGPYARRGLRRLGEMALTEAIPFEPHRHILDQCVEMAGRSLGTTARPRLTSLVPTADILGRTGPLRARHGVAPGRMLLIHAGHPASMKACPLESFRQAARTLAQRHGLQPVFVGRAEEVSFAESHLRRVGEAMPVLETPDLADLMALMTDARLFIANDGGPMHIAAALGVPTVGVFGPTDEEVYGPRGPHCWVVRQPGICGRRHYPWHLPECCAITGRECLSGITAATLIGGAEAALAATSHLAAHACAKHVSSRRLGHVGSGTRA